MENIKPPRNLLSKLQQNAPSVTLSENYGRTGGYYGDEDEETAGYSAIMIYIQLGLSDYYDLVLEVVNLMLMVQKDYRKYYPLLPCAFGKGDELIHNKKYFEMGYMLDKFADKKITEVLIELSGKVQSDVPAVLPKLFPKTEMRSLYDGKTRFEADDFLVIIAKKGELMLSESLKDKITFSMKKRILVVEIDGNLVNWYYRNFEFEFN